MKNLIIILLCAGCASGQTVVAKPEVPPPCPAIVPTTCSDQLTVLDSDTLAKGFTCPSNSRLTFPSAYLHSDKVLVLCQCK